MAFFSSFFEEYYVNVFFQYKVDCLTRALSSFPNVTFTINGTAFALTPLQYLKIQKNGNGTYECYTVFLPQDAGDDNPLWTLGDYFLYGYYSIFDIANNQVGFATSISYNWTQSIDPSLFRGSAATTITKSTITLLTTCSALVLIDYLLTCTISYYL